MIMPEITVTGTARVRAKIDSAGRTLNIALARGFHDIGLIAQRDARRFAPFLEGDLERSIDVQHNFNHARLFVANNSPAAKYAKKMHEGHYNLGKRSRQKATGGDAVGRRFMSRAVEKNRSKFKTILQQRIAEAFHG